jgi:hypothetical protein
MILKYQKENVWGFIDNARQAAHKDLDIDAYVSDYDKNYGVEYKKGEDPAEYMNGEKLPDNIIKSNKTFMVATNIEDEGINRHYENLLDENRLEYPAVSILLYLEDCKEYDAIHLITNQKAFLMNDKGQTIERLN